MARSAVSAQPDGHRPLKDAPAGAGQNVRSAHDDIFPAQQGPAHCSAFVAKDNDDNLCRITLSVDGVHCAGCIRKIESALTADPAVTAARLNFSTGRLAIIWRGDPAYADTLVRVVENLGYRAAPFDPRDLSRDSDKEGRFLLLCLGVAGFAAGNLMLLSFALWTTTTEIMGLAMRDFLHLVSALIALPAIVFAGRPFFRSAMQALRKGHTNMDVPISVALILTSAMSVFEMVRHGEHVYFDSAVMLMFFLLAGRYLDFRARASARSAAGGLLAMMAGTATVLEGGRQHSVAIRDLRADMIVQVGMGERIPADGIVISGESDLDTGLVTGESLPVATGPGQAVYSGTLNLSAPLQMKVARAAENSLLADIVRLMEKAEQGQARYVRLADRAARLYTPVVHTLALLTFLGWLLLGAMAWQEALMIGVTVLIITCPCALGLAVPVVQVLAIGRLMKAGIMVKSGDALERLAVVDTVMLDKTGTLTLGRPALVRDKAGIDKDIFRMAASLAVQSRHPLSKALAQAYDGDLLALDATEIPGKGMEAKFEGCRLRLGSRSWCGDQEAARAADMLELWFAAEDHEPVRFLFTDPLRADAVEVIEGLRRRGCTIRLLSGDREEAVRFVAGVLKIEEWRAGLSPSDKYAVLEDHRAQGRMVVMIGDGLNDAPVLAGAHVSLSPSTAIDMAQNAADIIFMGDRLAPVLKAYDTARFAQKLVKQNFALAVAYNMLAIPLAIAGFVTPMIAALAMSASSLLVIANSFRLRLYDERET